MKYDEIINHPHFEPRNHPRMSREMRAGQFAPYAALTGFDKVVRRTARFAEEKSKRVIISDVSNEGVDLAEDDIIEL